MKKGWSEMREISLHIMDIVQNSISAKASFIEIEINENISKDILKVIIKDNGCGMDEEVLKKVKDPFTTSRKTRKVGLGISLFEAACVRCGGNLNINSKIGVGTEVLGIMKYSHIDRAPIGRMSDTITTVLLEPNIEILYIHKVNSKEFIFDTREIRKIAGDNLNQLEILQWIKEYIEENLKEIGSSVW
jgi:anti-sigma regulatory factor (Ser/Thr protein kinase)